MRWESLGLASSWNNQGCCDRGEPSAPFLRPEEGGYRLPGLDGALLVGVVAAGGDDREARAGDVAVEALPQGEGDDRVVLPPDEEGGDGDRRVGGDQALVAPGDDLPDRGDQAVGDAAPGEAGG